MADPVVVQGSAVKEDGGFGSALQQSGGGGGGDNSEWQRGEKQENKCRDPIFAVLLYINVSCCICCMI